MKTILAYTHEYEYSGAALALYNLLRPLAHKYLITVYSPDDGPLVTNYRQAGISAWTTSKDLSDCRPDLFIGNTILGAPPACTPAFNKVPTVLLVHEGRKGREFYGFHTRAQMAVNLAKAVVFPNEWATHLYPPNPNKVVLRYGVEKYWSGRLTFSRPKVRFLVLGAVEERKGQDVAVRAFQELRRQCEGCELWIVGENRQKKFTEALLTTIRSAPTDIMLMSGTTPEQAREHIAEADVLLVPSRDESSPLTILEAQDQARLVLAVDDFGIPEYVIHDSTGRLVIDLEPGTWMHAMKWAVENPFMAERFGVVAQGRRRCRTLADYQQDFAQLVEQLI